MCSLNLVHKLGVEEVLAAADAWIEAEGKPDGFKREAKRDVVRWLRSIGREDLIGEYLDKEEPSR